MRISRSAANSPATVEHGRQLFYSKYACQSCHIVDTKNDKGYIGPTLTQVGSRLTPAWIYAWLKNPQALRPGATEPNQNMSDEDARALTAFLMSLKGPGGRGSKAMMMRSTASMTFRVFGSSGASLASPRWPVASIPPPPDAGAEGHGAGSALVESSGGHQVGATGTALERSRWWCRSTTIRGTRFPGRWSSFTAPAGVGFDPAAMLTDSSGQATTSVTLGTTAGPILSSTP